MAPELGPFLFLTSALLYGSLLSFSTEWQLQDFVLPGSSSDSEVTLICLLPSIPPTRPLPGTSRFRALTIQAQIMCFFLVGGEGKAWFPTGNFGFSLLLSVSRPRRLPGLWERWCRGFSLWLALSLTSHQYWPSPCFLSPECPVQHIQPLIPFASYKPSWKM